MLESYFQYQAGLAETESALQCPDDCDAPGCWMAEVIVEVSLVDLMRLSLALNVPVSRIFINHCHLGLQACEINPRYFQLLIKLKKPCHFLQKTRCMVHGSKPLNCVLFPEYHQIIGHWPKLVANRIFRSFPCVNSKIVVSDDRGKALKKLRRMSSREEALSYYYLIGLPSFVVDSKPLTRLLKRTSSKKRSFALADYDRLFNEHLQTTGFLESILDKILLLDTRKGMEGLIEKVGDDVLMEPLLEKRDHPEIIHRIKGDHFKPLKRKLQSPAVIFM